MNIEEILRNSPLAEKHLGDHIRQLVSTPPKSGRFLDIFSRRPERLEQRLQRTCNIESFQTIFREIGNIRDSDELDRRLIDAWAEIRVIEQLMCERFIDIRKVKTPADLVARYMSQLYAIQVTRISREPRFSDLPTGRIDQIYDRVKKPIDSFFWDSIARKNRQFKKAQVSPQPKHIRRIVLVTIAYQLMDSMNKHITCRQIKDSILALTDQHFEEVQWLLDGGDNAIFRVETNDGETQVRCVADWMNDRPASHEGDYENCYWREVDLDKHFPTYTS